MERKYRDIRGLYKLSQVLFDRFGASSPAVEPFDPVVTAEPGLLALGIPAAVALNQASIALSRVIFPSKCPKNSR